MKIVMFFVFAAAAAATPIAPAPRPAPEAIDVSARPVVELVTKSSGTVVVETAGTGQVIEMYSPSKESGRVIAIDWERTPLVETIVLKGSRVAKFYDSDGDGLPDVRRIYEKREGRLHLITSERLQWTAMPDEYDPRSKDGAPRNGKKG